MNLIDVISALNVSTIKELLSYFPQAVKIGRKDVLLSALMAEMAESRLEQVWTLLDKAQRLAVTEAVHDEAGVYRESRFIAKYGLFPAFRIPSSKRQYGVASIAPLCLFLHKVDQQWVLPADLRAQLAKFVPAPASNAMSTLEVLPPTCEEQPLRVRDSASAAQQELIIMLGIIDHGKLSVSDKTALPTGKSLRSIAESLPGGDFYAEQNGKDDDGTPAGPIKAFAWPMLLQAAGLAQRNGSKLGLTKAGVQATGAAPADTVRAIWQAWLKTTQLDEFSRVDFIKGQKTRSNVMTAVPPRRAVIAKALKRCRTEVWISVDEFSRCMQAENDRFELCRDPWDLYLADREYGSLGYEGGGDWNILQLRYLLCLLFEYCATLGMVDIAYIAPAYARDDYHELWGGQDYDYLSRYDGLMYFRLNALGAYCLGMRSSYTPPVAQVTGRLAAHASLQIELIEGELATNDLVQLENWAEPESPRHWRLSREKSVAAIERGHDIAHLLALLQRYDRQPLPSAIESFVRACSRQGRALTVVGNALLIECVDAETADLIAAHKPLAALCLRAGARHLVVRSEHEVKFRHATRAFGYGIVQ